MVERERLEDSGFGDELMEMQQMFWPVERLRLNYFAIDMLFEYEDDDVSTLMWCQGKVVDFIKEVKDKHVLAKIEWCDKYVRDGDSKVTKNQLKKTKLNPNTPVGGAWREDLHHKLTRWDSGDVIQGCAVGGAPYCGPRGGIYKIHPVGGKRLFL
jgi:hypothetical protein